MSSIQLVGGEKGGVGKSVFVRLLCQWLDYHRLQFCVLDTDLSHPTLLRCYPRRSFAVDLSLFESADQIMDRALGAEREVVVDLASRSLTPLARWIQSADVVSLARELSVQLVYFHVTDGGFESLRSLQMAMNLLGPTTRTIVVCNLGRSPDFSQLTAAPQVRAVLDAGGSVIELPALDPQIMFKISAVPLGLQAALFEGQEDAALTQMQKRRASAWLSRANAQLGPVLLECLPGLKGAGVHEAAAEAQPVAPFDAEAAVPILDPEVATAAEQEMVAAADTSMESADSDEAPVSGYPKVILPPAGTIIRDGARTWTEVGDDYQIHHVRYS